MANPFKKIAQYSNVSNAYSDWFYNGSNMQDEVGVLADPSLMTYYYKGKLYTRRGYPVSNYDNARGNIDLNNKQARLLDRYSLRRFLGFLGETSTLS
jgi:hypothetical protein